MFSDRKDELLMRTNNQNRKDKHESRGRQEEGARDPVDDVVGYSWLRHTTPVDEADQIHMPARWFEVISRLRILIWARWGSHGWIFRARGGGGDGGIES
jgi:hypothetical protein